MSRARRIHGGRVLVALCLAAGGLADGALPTPTIVANAPAAPWHWARVTPAGATVTVLTDRADDGVWARFGSGDAASEHDGVVRWQGSPPAATFRGTVKMGAAEAGAAAAGTRAWPRSLDGWWATDVDGRTWLGATYVHRGRWVDLTARLAGDLDILAWSDEGVLDARDQAWVPYRLTRACPQPPDCADAGLRAFGASGILTAGLAFDPVPEADAKAVPPVWLLAGELDAKGVLVGPYAASRRALFVLPDTSGARYPPFDPAPGTSASAGYATAAARAAGERPRVLVWTEEQVRGLGLVEHHRLYTWLGNRWSEPDSLDDCPLVAQADPTAGVRLTAFVRSADGQDLWVAGGDGVARRTGGQWVATFSWETVGLGGPSVATVPRPIARALVIDAAGRVWLATSRGLAVYGPDTPAAVDVPAAGLYLPVARKR